MFIGTKLTSHPPPLHTNDRITSCSVIYDVHSHFIWYINVQNNYIKKHAHIPGDGHLVFHNDPTHTKKFHSEWLVSDLINLDATCRNETCWGSSQFGGWFCAMRFSTLRYSCWTPNYIRLSPQLINVQQVSGELCNQILNLTSKTSYNHSKKVIFAWPLVAKS